MTLACGALVFDYSRAAPPEPLDPAFLDYLASVEGKDDNWTVVASEKERQKPADPPPVKTPETSPPSPPKKQEER